ncbi:ATP-binding protein [Streptomyces microflavus]|uniref:ATP-binding protein n=1 Tax=Streptomyces microflavus TaxID=1919 RepID=UPI00225598AF|nr:ATP-binding protein [Streptomyces microflavus]MCX4650307.1 ATP-binding protein [Streptomyces microflavus]
MDSDRSAVHPTAGGGRRRLLAASVQGYTDEDPDFSEGMKAQLQVLETWWCDPALGERSFTREEVPDLQQRQHVETFLNGSELRDASANDAILLFVAGHGEASPAGSHFLMLPGTDPRRLLATAYRTSDLIAAALDSEAKHVLVIVNTCYSRAVNIGLAQLVHDLNQDRSSNPTLAVLAATDIGTTVGVRELSELLAQVHKQLNTSAELTSEYLTFVEFMEQLHDASEATGYKSPHALLGMNGSRTPHLCLPNPGYRPTTRLVAPQRSQVAATEEDLRYWISRASGRPNRADPGWYFSGRRPLTRVLASFLDTGPPSGFAPSLIVTGTAGSGKSAVIARAVTLSDAGFRANPAYAGAVGGSPPDTVPPAGSIDVALLARQRTAEQVIGAFLDGLNQEAPEPEPGTDRLAAMRGHLLKALRELASTGRTTTFVVDGLDEADDPYLLVSQVVAPLAQAGQAALRLVIGVRSHLTSAAPGAPDTGEPVRGIALLDHVRQALTLATDASPAQLPPMELRTDGPETTDDVQEYLQSLLDDVAGAAFDAADAARRITAMIPDVSFLDARMAGGQLRGHDSPASLLGDPLWWDSLGLGLVGMLRRDLRELSDPLLTSETALALLRAAAFAQGAGIPWGPIWPALAEAVLDRPLPDSESAIVTLRASRLVGYLAQDTEDGRTVHRLAHERLAEVLRTEPHLLNASSRESQW